MNNIQTNVGRIVESLHTVTIKIYHCSVGASGQKKLPYFILYNLFLQAAMTQRFFVDFRKN